MSEREELLAALESPSAPLEARAAAGEALAALGDPRAARVDRVLIPAGSFLHRRAREAEGGEARPRADAKRVFVSAFRIDRHPVTVAAFAEFVAAGGYRRQAYWSTRGWRWRAAQDLSAPRFWGEAEWAAYLVPNHPVVGVSVYEAEAYAAFRGARLPTEAEWEKACAGERGSAHPWGDVWLDDACAMRSVGPRHTLPIGVFPRGRSARGVAELVGCVWQWCADVADDETDWDDDDPFVDPDLYADDAPRVTRGGAWNTLASSQCCTSRNAYPPGARFSNLGFRCAADVDG
jgi:iron(II)-dependent oxidoreductase